MDKKQNLIFISKSLIYGITTGFIICILCLIIWIVNLENQIADLRIEQRKQAGQIVNVQGMIDILTGISEVK